MKAHIQWLVENEGRTETNLSFSRTGANTIVVSTVGYQHMDQHRAEEALLKLGCKYDVSKGIQEFDRMCGRTFTHFIEPKE